MTSAAPTAVSSIFKTAINGGVPLFNSGDVEGCMQMYKAAAQQALSTPSSMNEMQVERVKIGLVKAESDADATKKAWTLRKMMDDVIAISEVTDMRASIAIAMKIGVPLFNAGDQGGCANIYRACLKGLITSLGEDSDETRRLGETAVVRLMDSLMASAKAAGEGSRLEDGSRAWELRWALELANTALNQSYGVETVTDVFDFTSDTTPWRDMNDVVMGGQSQGTLVIQDGVAIFKGELSTRNNGGFSSVRSPNLERNLPMCTGLAITCRGDASRYKLQVRIAGSFDGMTYQADFEPESETEFKTINIRFQQFNPSFRGSIVPNAPLLEGPMVMSLGLMNSKLTDMGFDNPQFRTGPFQLEVKKIATF